MPIEILMPALSPTMTEGNLAKWLKKEGDEVHSGDVLAEIETDKATMEVEAVDDGKLGKILVPEGAQGIKVNQPIAVLLGEDEDASRRLAAMPPSPPAAAPRHAGRSAGASQRRLRRRRPQHRSRPTAMAGTAFSPAHWRGGWRSRPASILPRCAARGRKAASSRPISKPHCAPPRAAPAPAATRPTAMPAAAPAVMPALSKERVVALAGNPPYTERPLTAMRRVIARRLTESKQTIPHFYLTIDCEIDALLKIRAELNAKSPTTLPGSR